jgi:hypothetical protein
MIPLGWRKNEEVFVEARGVSLRNPGLLYNAVKGLVQVTAAALIKRK